MRKDNRILIISFYFPPSSRVGGKRFAFLSKILQEKYPNLHVLTVKKKYYDSTDNSLSPGGVIHPTAMHPAYPVNRNGIFKKIFHRLWVDYFCLVDPYSGWIFPAFKKGLKVIKENKIDLIIATGPPFSTMVIGWLLSIVTKKKLVLDYRDPWTNIWGLNRKIFRKRINTFLERFIIRQASAIVLCTQKMKDNFIKDFGTYTHSKCYIINNAYENNAMIQPEYLSPDKISMIYAGAFYGRRKITLLTEPIIKLLKEGIITEDNFCFHIFGKLKDEDKKAIKESQLQNIIIEHPLIPHKELISYLKGSDILVIIVSPEMNYSVSYKFYDYLSVRKPIFAIIPENSEMQKMIKEVDCGQVAFINRPETILKNLCTMLSENRKYTYSGAERFTWNESGRKYSEVIKELFI
jgi:glycosyltransferase involved in cell wall biosynthesis